MKNSIYCTYPAKSTEEQNAKCGRSETKNEINVFFLVFLVWGEKHIFLCYFEIFAPLCQFYLFAMVSIWMLCVCSRYSRARLLYTQHHWYTLFLNCIRIYSNSHMRVSDPFIDLFWFKPKRNETRCVPLLLLVLLVPRMAIKTKTVSLSI